MLMRNQIRGISVYNRRLVPAEVELGITVLLEHFDSDTKLTGRLTGPHCRYTTTVQVPYPMRETLRRHEEDGPRVFLKVVIPEASFWEPAIPFLYEGPIELWEGSVRCDCVQICRGLRVLTLGPHGWRVNGKLLPFRGAIRDDLSTVAAEKLRKVRTNCLIVPVSPDTAPSVWEQSDRLGFVMLGRIAAEAEISLAWSMKDHPSVLGWIIEPELLEDPVLHNVAGLYPTAENHFLGVHLSRPPQTALPKDVRFIYCAESDLSALKNLDLPKVVECSDGLVKLITQP
jgi:hypothetical protein